MIFITFFVGMISGALLFTVAYIASQAKDYMDGNADGSTKNE